MMYNNKQSNIKTIISSRDQSYISYKEHSQRLNLNH